MRIFLVIIDGFGVGEMPDAKQFGDEGSNTFKNLSNKLMLNIPNLTSMGLCNIDGLDMAKNVEIVGAYGKMQEVSLAKDTTAGHWEIAGAPLEKPFVTFVNGFPEDLILKLQDAFGIKTLCNNIASGTEVINNYGQVHMQTKMPIIYTSADSVLQIACHEDVYSNEELYHFCEIAREICQGEYEVGRVIARPFAGHMGDFYRTQFRKDFSVEPKSKTILEKIFENNLDMIGIGKIEDIFPKRFLTQSFHTHTNDLGMKTIIKLMDRDFEKGLVFANLVDTDMVYGHRNDCHGYRIALEEIDDKLGIMLKKLKDDDVLILTADHGNDPTTESTDHSREYVPVLMAGEKIKKGINLGTKTSFASLGYTILDMLNLEKNPLSFYEEIRND